MARFFKNSANKENLFNLIETAFIQDKVRLGRRCFSLILIIVQRSPKVRCLKYQNNLWEENYFPVNLDDVFTNQENLEIDDNDLEGIDYEDFSESRDSEF